MKYGKFRHCITHESVDITFLHIKLDIFASRLHARDLMYSETPKDCDSMEANLDGEQRDQTLIGGGSGGCNQQYGDEAMTRINYDLTQVPQIIPPSVGCHTNCAICEENYHTVDKQQHSRSLRGTGREWPTVYTAFFKDDDAAEKSFHRQLNLVTEDFNYLADILRTHGDLIANRWTKKSSHKRGALLGSAAHICFGIWPPVTERDFAGQQGGGTGKLSFAEALSVNALFGSGACGAWIDIEEFAQYRMKLLSFLHVRSAYPPCDWATFDARKMVRYSRDLSTGFSSTTNASECLGRSSDDWLTLT